MDRDKLIKLLDAQRRKENSNTLKRLLREIDEDGDCDKALLTVGNFISLSSPRPGRDALLMLKAVINSALEGMEGGNYNADRRDDEVGAG